MKNLSASTSPLNNSFSSMVINEMLSEAQVIAWSCALASEAAVIFLSNLLTIVLFTFNKKLRNKKSLYLVMNMAFADLVWGGASLPLFVYLVTATRSRLYFTEFLTFLQIIFTVFSVSSFTTPALISAERFYAVFWPLKHRTLSTREYKLVILMAWTLATLFSTAYILLFRLSLGAFFAFATLYGLLLIVTICGLNIVTWRKIQQKSVHCYQKNNANKHANPAFDESSVISICWYLEFLDPRNYYLFVKIFRSKHIFKRSPFHLFYTFFQFFYQSNDVRIKNS